jgi:hypothetical protein
MKLTQAQISTIIRKIYNGTFSPTKLPKKLYSAIAEHLTNGVYKGYDSVISEVVYDSPDYIMLQELRVNTYLFSAAKTFNYVLSTENLIVQGNEVLPFKEFKSRALEVYDKYNVTWLESEYNTAIGQAQSARAWGDFSDGAILKYVVTPGVKHAQTCLEMDGVTRPKNDDIWRKNSPLNHYNCLCHLDASFDNISKPLPKNITPPSEGFDINPGIDKKVFNDNHPYFTEIPPKYKKFAKTNFGLDIPE